MLDHIDECDGQTIDPSLIKLFVAKLGYEEELQIMYRIPTEGGKYNLMRQDIEEHVSDMAAIGMIYVEVEVFIMHDFHSRFIEREVEGDEFYDSDYEVRGGEDGMIYEKYVDVDVDERGELVVNCRVGLEKEKDLSNVNAEVHGKKELTGGEKEDLDIDLYLYDRKNIEDSSSLI
ncbi:hypothetical protein ACH5RR_022600 [Cinchona calisaya]|uniref:Uncharacterized protein n=1 Tax=Cinchona calisaya TaxID=153742 RepID=A0ABD2Z896_9GENT